MDLAGQLTLPVEVLHHIGRFLAVEEILACSATCHYLRCAFNSNSIWKRFLPEQLVSDLDRKQFLLEHALPLEGTITPLCENRIIFIKRTNIVNNWKSANFVNYHLDPTCYHSAVLGKAIYKDHYLFLICYKNGFAMDAIEVWDINKEPALLIELKMTECELEYIYIVGDYLVVAECVQVKVYEIKISEKALPLLFSFLTTENDVVFNEPALNHPWSHDFRCEGWSYSEVGDYLLANKCESEPYSCVFHVWDIKNACKVGSFLPPISIPGLSMVWNGAQYCSVTGSKWFVEMLDLGLSDDVYVFQFDIENKLFSENVFYIENFLNSSQNFFMNHNSSLILFDIPEGFSEGSDDSDGSEGFCDVICTVYDFTSSQKLQERRFNNAKRSYDGIELLESTKIINGQFILLCIDGFHVIDALSLETLVRFPKRGVNYITHQLNILGSVFILAANLRDTLNFDDQNTWELWDVRERKKVEKDLGVYYHNPRLWRHGMDMEYMYLNSSCSKLACVCSEGISVYHFL